MTQPQQTKARTAGPRIQKRDNQGRYDHEGDWDRLCVCGHTLGVHCAESPADCLLHSFADYTQERVEHANTPNPECGCAKFRPKRSKGKFVYLDRAALLLANPKPSGAE